MKQKLSISIALAILLSLSVYIVSRSQTIGPIVVVTCPASVTFNNTAQTPCSASYFDENGVETTGLTVTYGSNTDVTTAATASASYTDALNNTYTGSSTFQITPANTTVVVDCTAGAPHTYTGSAQTPCTATAIGPGLSEDVSGSLVYTGNLNAGSASVTASYAGSGNYNPSPGSGGFTIAPADATCDVSDPQSLGTWNGNPKYVSGSCKDIHGVTFSSGLTLPGSSDPGTYTNQTWTFSSPDTNYNSQSGTVTYTIDKADATCTIVGDAYDGPYDGFQHPTSGSCKGIHGEDLGFNWGGTPITDVGFASGFWSFSGNNDYNANPGGSWAVIISPADADCSGVVNAPNTYVYDGSSHGASGSCKGARGASLSVSFTGECIDVPGCSANWSLTNSNYNSQNGLVTITINQAASTVKVTCSDATYTGLALTPCTAEATGPNLSIDLTPELNYSNNTNAPGPGSADVTWSGDGNHTGSSNSAEFNILPADSTVTVTCTVGAPYNYTGSPITPCSASATGPGMSPVDVSASLNYANNTNAGQASAFATWAGDADHKASQGSGSFTINQIDADCSSIIGWTGDYTGAAHGASGACTGLSGTLTGLSLGLTYRDVPGGPADWSFSNTNYKDQSGSVPIIINQVSSSVSVTCPASVTYNGSAQTPCTASASGVGLLLDVSSSLVYANNTDVGTATASINWGGDTNHTGSSGSKTFNITRAIPSCNVSGYNVPYDGNAHTATGTCTGFNGEDLFAGVDLSGTTRTNAGSTTDTWTYTDFTGNYQSITVTINDTITRVNPTCNVIPYNVAQDGLQHTATGTCTGVKSEDLSLGLNLTGTRHGPAAGDWPNDRWTYTDSNGNYNNLTGTVHDHIGSNYAACTVTGYTVVYDGNTHQATGICLGTGGVDLSSGLNLTGTAHIPPGTYNNDPWSFSYAGYPNQNGTVNDRITGPAPTCTVTPYNVPYDGIEHIATGTCTGLGGVDLSVGLNLNNTRHIPIGLYTTDTWTYTDPNGVYASIPAQTITDAIGTNYVTCTVTGYTVTYDGNVHQATGSCTGPGGISVSGLDLSTTRHSTPGTYSDRWNFSNPSYLPTSGPVTDRINTVQASCTVVGWSGPVDGQTHSASGSCTGLGGTPLPSTYLNLGPTRGPGAGSWNNNWTFRDPNGIYANQNGTVRITISNTTATCTINGYSGTYDGNAHGLSGTCTGNGGQNLSSGLSLGTQYTNVGTYSVHWTFSYTGYTSQSGNGPVIIRQAPSTVTVSNCATLTYTGGPLAPSCTATATGVGMAPVDVSSSLTYSSNTNAGTGTATASWAGDNNHTGSTGTGSFTINKAPSTFTVICTAGAPYTYTGSAQTPCTATATGVGLTTPVDVTGLLTYSNNIHAGSASASATWPGDANHNSSTGSGSFTIGKITSTVTVSCPANVTYTGSPLTPCTASATGVGITTPVNVTASIGYSNNTNAGTATATANWGGDTDHTGNTDTRTFTIDQAPSMITIICPASVGYTGAALEPCTATARAVGASGAGIDVTSSLSYSSNINAGTASVEANWGGNANLSGSSASGSFKIDLASSTVRVTCPASVTYTGNQQTPCTATASGPGMSPQDVSSSLSYSNNTAVGTATATANWGGDPNHKPSSGSASFSIGKATSTVTVTCSGSVTYNGLAQTTACTALATGVGLGTGVDVSGSLVYTNNIDAGNATVTATWAGDANHTGSNGTGSFSIGKAASTVTVTCPLSRTYTGSALTPCTASATGPGLPSTDVSSSLTYSNNINAGTATANANWGGDANHTGNTGSGSFLIAKADVKSCIVTGYDVPFDGTAHTATGACTGLLGEDLTGLDLTLTTHTAVGDYLADKWSFTNSNYNDYNGTVDNHITKADATCVVTGYSVPFDGTAHTATGTCTGLNNEVLTGLDLSGTVHTLAGDFPSDPWNFINANYASRTGYVHDVITKISSTVTVTCPASVPYTGFAQTPCTASATGIGMTPVNVSFSLVYANNTSAGTATVTANWAGDANHIGGNGTGSFTIDKVASTITVTCPASVAYNGAAQTPCTASVTGVGMNPLDITSTLVYANNTNAGTATVTASWAGDVNRNSSTGTGSFIINQVAATCTVAPYAVPYDGNAHTATGTCTGLGGVTLTGLDVSGTSNTNAGDYPDDAWTFTNGNYLSTGGTVHDSISKVEANCIITGWSGAYNGSPHGANGSCTGVGGATLAGLNFGQSFTDVPGGTATWIFSDANYNDQNGRVDITIAMASSQTTVTCPATVLYTGSALTPCSAVATGAGGLSQLLLVTYTSNTEVGTAKAYASFPGDGNHFDSSDSATFNIALTLPTVPGAAETQSALLYTPPTATPNPNLKEDVAPGSDRKAGAAADNPLAASSPEITETATGIGGDNKALITATPTDVGSDRKAHPTPTVKGATAAKPQTSGTMAGISGSLGCIGVGFLGLLLFFMTKRRKKDEPEVPS